MVWILRYRAKVALAHLPRDSESQSVQASFRKQCAQNLKCSALILFMQHDRFNYSSDMFSANCSDIRLMCVQCPGQCPVTLRRLEWVAVLFVS